MKYLLPFSYYESAFFSPFENQSLSYFSFLSYKYYFPFAEL